MIDASPLNTAVDDNGKEKDRSGSYKTAPVYAAKTTGRRSSSKKSAASSSSTKPLWKTILGVFTKNLVLLIILVVMLQMLRRSLLDQLDGNVAILSSDYERRIAEAEKFLKTTTKMIQDRIDYVDEKIRNEIVYLKNELSNSIDDNAAKFSGQLEELGNRVIKLEKTLISGSNWLSRDEFERFIEEFKVHSGFDTPGAINLDEIRAFAKELVEKEIGKHAADGLGMVDYAAASGGGTVVKHSDPLFWKLNSFNPHGVSSEAVKMLQPSFGEPGQCFPLKGNTGFVQIELRTAIIPVAVTLEHVAKSVAYDLSSAPKECRVFGWLQNKGTVQMHLLTEFVYDLEKSSIQTFDVSGSGSGSSVVDSIRLEFTSNHGNPRHTCIYRLRVHGQEPGSLLYL